MSPAEITHFFEQDPAGFSVAQFALRTLSLFAFALLVGRIASSLALGVLRINSFLLVAIGSAITTLGLGVAFTAGSVETARLGLVAAGFGMGPIFPTSVGLASVIVPRIAGTAMSWVMGIGFAGLLLIPPAVGYVSSAVGGHAGDVRTGLMVVLAASVLMLLLHIALAVRERRRAKTAETDIEIEAPAKAG
jgi:MFS family permease